MNISRRRILTVIGAPAAALAVWTLAVPLGGVTLTVRAGDATRTVGPTSIVVTSLLAGLVGWGLMAVLERWVARPGLIWAIAAPPTLLASLSGPLDGAVGTAAVLVLVLLHLAVAAVLFPGLMPVPSERRRPPSPAAMPFRVRRAGRR